MLSSMQKVSLVGEAARFVAHGSGVYLVLLTSGRQSRPLLPSALFCPRHQFQLPASERYRVTALAFEYLPKTF